MITEKKIIRKFKTEESRIKYLKRIKDWKINNKEQTNRLARLSYHRNKHKHIEDRKYRHLKLTYNITKEDYINLLKNQNYKCLICGREVDTLSTKLCIDHNHKTGKIRGLICRKCNGALGWYELYYKSINNYLKLSKNDN
jgi:DNA-directed RNA polymerase subunit RPC12/RpoP